MGIKQRLLIGLLTISLTFSLCTPAWAFSAEPDGWAAEQVRRLQDDGLLTWDLYTGGISPNEAIRRGDFCQLLVNVVQMEGDWNKIQNVKPVEVGYFDDLNDLDSGYAMYYAAAYGITEGSQDYYGRILSDANSLLTREQAAKMMCALIDALETYGEVSIPQEGESRNYTDRLEISSWAAESVDRASALGILQGNDDGRFNPRGSLTWQEACVMIDRIYSAAEKAVIERKAQMGIKLNSTNADITGNEYIYALEHDGEQSVLYIDMTHPSIHLESYNTDGTSAGVREIPMELTKCGGFYEGEDSYYLAFGQDNMEEDDSKTVYRIVKYDKNWNRQGAADINDCYTTESFRHTSHTAMAEENGVLVFHTARLRYLTTDDNLRHQSNFTAKIRTSDMSVISKSEQFPKNHVSHSFAQYVAFDNGLPVYIDHGDAYPRGFAVNVENSQGGCREQNFFPFYGEIGDNTTNAVPAGMGISADNYLFLGASAPQDGNSGLDCYNVFLSVIPKNNGQAQTKWLTDFSAGEKALLHSVQFAQIDNNTFVAMWQSVRQPSEKGYFYNYGDLQYAIFNGRGEQVGEIQSLPGYMGAIEQSVYGNRIIWAAPELDISNRYFRRKSRYMQIFELKIDSNGATTSNDFQSIVQPTD